MLSQIPKVSTLASGRNAGKRQSKNFPVPSSRSKDGKAMNFKAIFGIMGLAVKQGEEVTLTFDGADEDAAYEAISNFMKENL